MMRPALVLIALLTALPVSAEIFSWKDKDGKVNFSDVPPPTGEVKTLREAAPRPATTTTSGEPAAKPKTLAEKELEFRQRRAAEAEAQAKAEKEQSESAERQRVCEDMRNQLAALKSGQRIARFNSAGERVMLTDAERGSETERIQKQIDESCK
ncbi:MAG: DUF4124 domain-containing protein [Azoarcus sp.]|uniref:DUF4124 domain-containing protein n=1 Tax=Parazoarcus communis TaxID=41977 RepID=A0A2U8GM36_9RHOO|nr:DUF4124 domain-containing protein [Parazoarcus communis]AWI74669.1 DUF4124 domain-containing protein [Parazoarcus communis]PLX68416.1 MAG: DUF4124 domain-containing protein [Azoarcus sp.]TVT56060.1 MAG: DUF4124 domain-containing protein [Azoarcus sp. PHD]|tara:strand:+ start:6787 stop:7248 length:462 start_codon:yes stop_codon:yes gene_type:complete